MGATGGGEARWEYPVYCKGERVNIDEDGYETANGPKPRTLGQYVPEIFAVDAEKPGDSITNELSKKRLCGDSCSKRLCDRRRCKEEVRSRAKDTSSVEGVVQKTEGEANFVRATPGWERARVQVDSGPLTP